MLSIFFDKTFLKENYISIGYGHLFTGSALWAGSVIELPCPCVSLFVIKIVIVNIGQSIRFLVFLFKIEGASMIQRILNL